MNQNQMPWRERISYGLGDTASNLIFQMTTLYLMYFYTDVFGLNPAAVAVLFLVARVVDAIAEPFIGVMIDRTQTKWGKCRPYFLWLAVPFSITAVLMFLTPDFGDTGKLVYAYISYTLLGIMYSGINLPLSAILPSLTSNSNERTVINTVRMVFAIVGVVIVSAGTMPLVNAFGGGNEAKGFFVTILLFSVIALLLFLNMFANTKERVKAIDEKPLPFRVGVQALKGNTPWLIMLLLGLFMWITTAIQGQTSIYYMTYYMKKPELISIVNSMQLLMIVSMVFAPFAVKKIGKRNTILIGSIVSIGGYIVAIVGGNAHSVPGLLSGLLISGLGMGVGAGLIFAMMADTVDYGEWRSGVRAQGLLYSASSFGVKVGMGIGGALGGLILSMGGYVAKSDVQSSSALAAISFNYLWAPIIGQVIMIILLLFYRLDKIQPAMLRELEERRNGQVHIR
ncbi:glycoside-pentoside-hexuronide (GPH):cation symporter [Paenibacillus macquariensis]|uniref:Glycoside/pentoside/hexuronide:cation symporter, GPH family n=1 Tax=Paenibacillus macquariensis TaxID=948756 RepID=A0ABY1JQQ7_9BACL|nr:MFS transporter [Paenibacillus macquariensis]MEC0092594.1 MFS transporter [Paenibacillus macquariensis]OAB36542.1 sodium:solute symporter [Paenibacillus macquariensis subsp. macquariensis]SIQ61885.1 glycoside/pentoside/hexuronide:cation symporter, GPH family [Paenibacillus macquariensis]